MKTTKKVPILFLVGILATVTLISATVYTNPSAEAAHGHDADDLEPRFSSGDTIGDIQIRAVFHFSEGIEVVDSFRIFNQIQGYDAISKPTFELTGGVGPDKQMLYHVTDFSHHTRHDPQQSQYQNFDIDVYLMNGENVYRMMVYASCDVTDYTIFTLHDGDETFSGLTKFVIADEFTFECDGFHPHCPSCEATDVVKPNLKSSLDYEKEQLRLNDIYGLN